MIVWIASFPRSGNTFLRILLNRLYGVRSSVIYDVDGVAERLGRDLVGFEERADTFEARRASSEIHFIKTHAQRDERVHDADPAICLVRDGRDALVSWARQTSEAEPDTFEARLHEMIERTGPRGTGSWGSNVLSWLQPPVPHRVVLPYVTLVANPLAAVEHAMSVTCPGLLRLPEATVPTFAELQALDGRFFRRGHVGTHRDELPNELHDLFWSHADNVAAMTSLGLGR